MSDPRIRRGVRLGLLIFAIGGLVLGCISHRRSNMIYFPRRYPESASPGRDAFAAFRPYLAADGREQWGHLIEPEIPANAASSRPQFYLTFNGNGAVAADMVPIYEDLAERTGCGFFLVDYRGYGFNDGRPSEKGLVADALGAYDTLAAEGRFESGVGVIGHSIGGAAAIALASERRLDRLITLSTFTSVDAIAKQMVGWPLYLFNTNHWPNDERLKKIVNAPDGEGPSRVVLIHGKQDEVIPYGMAEELAAIADGGAELISYERATHNDIFDFAIGDLALILNAEVEAAR